MLRRACLLLALALAPAAIAHATAGVVRGARAQVGVTTQYDSRYARLAYPGGDVPLARGVCADVVVRAFRRVGIDLQVRVHEDMRANFAAYPKAWGLRAPDANIDHRRVLNLETYLRRRGFEQRGSFAPGDFQAGDIVSWRLPGGMPHIGVVSDRKARDGSGRPLVIHNVGAGAREEDALFAWPLAGHFRWRFAGAARATGRPARLAWQGAPAARGPAMDGDAPSHLRELPE